ncbi:UNVERIFIED_CONTAM: hypothetical protein HDU68_008657 [Siphonaria sp. JEL0065]|nr:hypothetical protein HDU68_008657 [Siphonaria sp. JEL0065]
MPSNLSFLQEAVNQDPFLVSAKLEPHLLVQSLKFHDNNVEATIKALTNYAIWYKENLGHQSKRVSIVHIHAFLLEGVYTILPNVTDNKGNAIVAFRAYKDTRNIPKQYYATLSRWIHDWKTRSSGPDHTHYDHSLFLDFDSYRFKTFRPSHYKLINEAIISGALQPKDSALYVFNASKTAIKVFNATNRVIYKDVTHNGIHFIKREELKQHMNVDMIPVDFGGNRSLEDAQADLEDFIRSEYIREGLRYEQIDIKNVDWKTYKVPDVDMSAIRPESAMTIASNIDFDEIDARIEALGLGAEE